MMMKNVTGENLLGGHDDDDDDDDKDNDEDGDRGYDYDDDDWRQLGRRGGCGRGRQGHTALQRPPH